MIEPFIISDLHLFHENICKWEGARPWDDAGQMTHDMIGRWNGVVGVDDKVIILGDLFNRKAINVMRELNGRKTLIMGNHDQAPTQVYLDAGIEKLLSCWELAGGIFTHIPIHTSQLERWKFNAHGHTHNSNVKVERERNVSSNLKYVEIVSEDDSRYINMCVEKWNYTPVKLHVVLNELRGRGINV